MTKQTIQYIHVGGKRVLVRVDFNVPLEKGTLSDGARRQNALARSRGNRSHVDTSLYHWRLNERHYGALQGLKKAETAARHGEAQVKIWRRSYDIPPPALTLDDPRHPAKDLRYAGLNPGEIPQAEPLKDTVGRFLPYWHETIAPVVQAGKRVLIAAHGNSLRALVKYLDQISDQDIVELNIPTGIPLVYELRDDLTPIRHFYLGDPEAAKRAAQAVANQLKKK